MAAKQTIGLMRVIGIAKAVNLNPPTAPVDVATLAIFPDVKKYVPAWLTYDNIIGVASSSMAAQIYLGPNQTGGFVYSAADLSGLENLNGATMLPPLTAAMLYINVNAPQGNPLTADILLVGLDLTDL
jgi:hypothetical protein